MYLMRVNNTKRSILKESIIMEQARNTRSKLFLPYMIASDPGDLH